MRFALTASLAMMLVLQLRGPQPAVLEGVVVREGTGQPVQGATVSAAAETGNPRTGTSGEDGRFRIENLPAGRYTLTVLRTGFVRSRQNSGPVSLALAAAEELTGLRFVLAPTAVITGRITDDGGNPINRASVSLLQYQYDNGRRTLVPVPAARATTDERGDYRLFNFPAGDYIVDVETSLTAHTYYPAATDPADAISVTTVPGIETGGIHLRISRQPRFSATLKLVRPPERASAPLIGLQIFRQSRTGIVLNYATVGIFISPGAPASPQDVAFTTPSLPPGSYIAVYDSGSQVERIPFDIVDRNLDLGTFVIRQGVAIAGGVRVSGVAPAVWSVERLRIALLPLDLRSTLGIASLQSQNRVAADGTFLLALPAEAGSTTRPGIVAQGRYQVSVTGLSGDLYLAAAQYGGVDVLHTGLVVDATPPGPLELTILNGGALDGVVTQTSDQPVANGIVALIPAPNRRGNLTLFRNTVTDQYGRFTFRGVAPGEYTVLAFEDVDPGAWMNAGFLGTFEPHGTRVSVTGGLTSAVSLRVIPAR